MIIYIEMIQRSCQAKMSTSDRTLTQRHNTDEMETNDTSIT